MRKEIAKVFASGWALGTVGAAFLTYVAVQPMSGSDFEERWDAVVRGQTTSQGRALEDGFQDAVQRVRLLALGLKNLLPLQQPVEWGPILHFSEMQASAGKITQIKNSTWFNQAKNESISDEQILNEIKEKTSLQHIRENGYSVVRMKLDPNQARDHLALVFMASAQGAVGQPDVLISAIVDPSQAFPGFLRFASRSEGGSLRAYLISDEGRVLAHSQPNYVGSYFSDAPIFKEALKATLEGRRLAGSGSYQSIDQMKVAAAYTRVGTLPLAIVVEKVKTGAPVLTRHWTRWGIQLLGVLAAVVALAYALVTRASSRWARVAAAEVVQQPVFEVELLKRANRMAQKTENELKAKAETLQSLIEDLPVTPQMLTAAQEALVAGPADGVQTLPEDLKALPDVRDEESLLMRFEKEMLATQDIRKASARLASLASRLCKSPTLFFVYQERLEACVLKCYAGFDGDQAPKAMAFSMPKNVLQNIYAQEQRGQQVSLVDYTALAQILLERTGVSHFEAWAVTGYGEQGRQKRQPQQLGVLVVLKAGYESAIRRDTLARAMRITGTVYENTASANPTATTQ